MLTGVVLLVLICANSIAAKDNGPVTCGSAIKLIHKETGNNLHSHAIAWGSGSGQQSVTSNGNPKDKGSLWLVKEGHNKDLCEVGTPVKCGDIVRLEHVETGKNLHSHLFRSPLSGNQEVSGFGEEGFGDTGDNWKVMCDSAEGDFWRRYKPITLMHADTSKFLSTGEQFKFTRQNCGAQCPIMDQTEVSSSSKKDIRAKWQTDQGVYFPFSERGDDSGEPEDDEL